MPPGPCQRDRACLLMDLWTCKISSGKDYDLSSEEDLVAFDKAPPSTAAPHLEYSHHVQGQYDSVPLQSQVCFICIWCLVQADKRSLLQNQADYTARPPTQDDWQDSHAQPFFETFRLVGLLTNILLTCKLTLLVSDEPQYGGRSPIVKNRVSFPGLATRDSGAVPLASHGRAPAGTEHDDYDDVQTPFSPGGPIPGGGWKGFDEDDEEQLSIGRSKSSASNRSAHKVKVTAAESSKKLWHAFQEAVGLKAKPLTGERVVHVNDEAGNASSKFCSNYVSTSKYNVVTFLPKFFYGSSYSVASGQPGAAD